MQSFQKKKRNLSPSAELLFQKVKTREKEVQKLSSQKNRKIPFPPQTAFQKTQQAAIHSAAQIQGV